MKYYNRHDEESARIHDYLIDSQITSEDAISLALNLCGTSIDTYRGILFSLTGCRSFDQLQDIE